MTRCSIELNDAELRVDVAGRPVIASPGYACAVDGRIEFGERALAQAQLHPRTTENRYWRDLNTTPLHQFGRRVRHLADLAYLQLEQLRAQAGHPTEAVFAVPGNLSHEQLALLLGIAQACRLTPVALIDSAVAAAAAALGPGRWVHVDLQQHQAVVTTLDVTTQVTRERVEVLPGLGINALRAACVQAITGAFVTHCRFDPLHHAATEQLLYDHLPQWLELLATHTEVNVQLAWRGARFDTRVTHAMLVQAVSPLLSRLRAALPVDRTAVASHRLAAQPGFREVFGDTAALAARAVFDGLPAELGVRPDGIRLVTALPTVAAPAIASPAPTALHAVTHVLERHTATALSQAPLYLLASGGCARQATPLAWCHVELGAHGAELIGSDPRVRVNGEAIDGPVELVAGDRISFVGAVAQFTAIAVLSPNDA